MNSAPQRPDHREGRPTWYANRALRLVPARAGWMPFGDISRRAVVTRLALAFGLAAALWAGVSQAQDPVRKEVFKGVPIAVRTAPKYSPINSLPAATVSIEGLSSDVQDVHPTAFVDLTRVTSTAPHVVPVQVDGLPQGVQVDDVVPNTVGVTLQTALTRDVPVDVVKFGQVPPGYAVPKLTWSPHTVTISGPGHTVERIAKAQVALDYATLTRADTRSYPPQLVDRNNHELPADTTHVVRVKPPSISVSIETQLQPFPQTLLVVPNVVGAPAPGYRFNGYSYAPHDVGIISGSQVSMATLSTAPISITGWTASRTVQAPLLLPSGAVLAHPNQSTATVTINIVPVPASAVATAQLLVVGKRPGTTVQLGSTSVTVAYQGPLSSLQRAGAPLATLDLHNRPPGVYQLQPHIALPAGLSTQKVTPSRVRVVIYGPPRPKPTATLAPEPTPRPHKKTTSGTTNSSADIALAHITVASPRG